MAVVLEYAAQAVLGTYRAGIAAGANSRMMDPAQGIIAYEREFEVLVLGDRAQGASEHLLGTMLPAERVNADTHGSSK